MILTLKLSKMTTYLQASENLIRALTYVISVLITLEFQRVYF